MPGVNRVQACRWTSRFAWRAKPCLVMGVPGVMAVSVGRSEITDPQPKRITPIVTSSHRMSFRKAGIKTTMDAIREAQSAAGRQHRDGAADFGPWMKW